jgi:hypothetical protein
MMAAAKAPKNNFCATNGCLLRFLFALLAVAGALILAAIFRPAMRRRLAALFVSLAIALYAAELAIRWIFPRELPDILPRSRAAAAAGVRFDKRNQGEAANDLRRSGVRAFSMASPATVMELVDGKRWSSPLRIDGQEVVPLGGVARVRTMAGNESGVMAEFDSDEMGFNNPPGLWERAPVSVVVLGDSFAVGFGVPPEKNLAAPIRARFPRTVNLGVTGLGPLAELGDLREFGPALRPQAAVMLFYEGNDMRDLNREKLSLLARYLEPGFTQGLLVHREAVDQALAADTEAKLARLDSLWFRASQVAALTRVRELTGLREPDPNGSGPADWDIYRRVLHEARVAPEAWGGRLWLVYLPKWARFTHLEEVPSLDRQRATVLEAAKSEGVPVIDAIAVFGAAGDPLDAFPYRMHGHYSEHGHRVLGEAIARELAAAGVTARPAP